MWRAASQTATSITGDVALGAEKITINFVSFPMVQVRALQKDELRAAFSPDAEPNGSGNLYHMEIPGEKRFLHKNTLCGGENAEWMITYVSGRSLQLEFFSGDKPPVLTTDALGNSTDSCGTYSYVR